MAANPDTPGIEPRLARIESDVAHLGNDVREIRLDVREVRSRPDPTASRIEVADVETDLRDLGGKVDRYFFSLCGMVSAGVVARLLHLLQEVATTATSLVARRGILSSSSTGRRPRTRDASNHSGGRGGPAGCGPRRTAWWDRVYNAVSSSLIKRPRPLMDARDLLERKNR